MDTSDMHSRRHMRKVTELTRVTEEIWTPLLCTSFMDVIGGANRRCPTKIHCDKRELYTTVKKAQVSLIDGD